MTIKELQAKREQLAAAIKQHAEKCGAGSWSAEQTAEWEGLNAAYDENKTALDAAISEDEQRKQVAQRLEQLNRDARTPGNQPAAGIPGREDSRDRDPDARRETVSLAIKAWFKAQMDDGDLSDREMEACQEIGVRPFARRLTFACPTTQSYRRFQGTYAQLHPSQRSLERIIQNAPLTTTTGSSGGNIVQPEDMIAQLELAMLAIGGLREAAELMITSQGNDLSWPSANDTGNSGRLVAESTAIDDNAGGGSSGDGGPNPTFAKKTWSAYKFTSDTILVPYELLEDSAVMDLPGILGQMLGERLGRITNTYYTTGTGSSQPQGVVTAASAGVTAAAVDAIDTEEVIDLQHSLDPSYRVGAQFMCNDAVIKHLRKKKTADGQFIWQSGLQAGVPDMLAGWGIILNQAMATLATGNVTLLAGQFSRYKIRRVNGIRMYRLGELYRATDKDGFVALLREDGGLLNAGGNPVTKLTQA